MKRTLFSLLALAATLTLARAGELLPVEQQVAEAVKSKGVTVVHFWATWCPNCKAEFANNGWTSFVEANPNVNFIFVTVRDPKPGTPVLETYGLSAQKNFMSLQHPNGSHKDPDQISSFMGIPMTWQPSTWVFREGKLRFALNYGEVHFSMLQQLVEDSSDPAKWRHAKPADAPAAAPAPATAPTS